MAEQFNKSETPEGGLKGPTSEELSKVKYWDEFARRHIPEMRILFRGSKFWDKEGWRNVIEHSLPQGAAAEVLSDMLQLPEKEKEKLVKNAICHDWDKRLEKRPEDFTDADHKKVLNLLKDLNLDPDLIDATKIPFREHILNNAKSGKEISVLQMLMFYIDNMTTGGEKPGEFIPFERRMAEVKSRYPELPEEFWEKERETGYIVQNKLFELLKGKGVLIEEAGDIPELVRRKIEEKYK